MTKLINWLTQIKCWNFLRKKKRSEEKQKWVRCSSWHAMFILFSKKLVRIDIWNRWLLRSPMQGWNFLLWFLYSPTSCAWSLGWWNLRISPDWSGYVFHVSFWGRCAFPAFLNRFKMVFLDDRNELFWIHFLSLELLFCHFLFFILFALLLFGFDYVLLFAIALSFYSFCLWLKHWFSKISGSAPNHLCKHQKWRILLICSTTKWYSSLYPVELWAICLWAVFTL